MVAPFRICIEDIRRLDSIHRNKAFSKSVQDVGSQKKSLKTYITGDSGVLDGDILQNDWFPTGTHYDVFISHSHDDEQDAIKLADWLEEECDLKCFRDYETWKSADKLLFNLDELHCKIGENTYSYEQGLYSSAHVHAMLSMALLQMIDHADFFIFIESAHSLQQSLAKIEDQTLSPWLYEELLFADKINYKSYHRKQERISLMSEGGFTKRIPLKIYHRAPMLKDFHIINFDLLRKLAVRAQLGKSAADFLFDSIKNKYI